MFDYNYIAIEGNIGAGKTTLAKFLSNAFQSSLLLEEFSENKFLKEFYKLPDLKFENILALVISTCFF